MLSSAAGWVTSSLGGAGRGDVLSLRGRCPVSGYALQYGWLGDERRLRGWVEGSGIISQTEDRDGRCMCYKCQCDSDSECVVTMVYRLLLSYILVYRRV